MKNNLLEEIWRVRDKIGAECGYDLKQLGALIHREEVKAGRRLVRADTAKKKLKTIRG